MGTIVMIFGFIVDLPCGACYVISFPFGIFGKAHEMEFSSGSCESCPAIADKFT